MKRLAIYLDGTWNTLNNNANVWRLKSLTAETADQRVYYSQGVGTQRGEAARGGITGWGIDDEIIEAYTWLIQNFEDGDEIFIFGFSRGAYTARSLSGLICKCGILKLGAPLSIEQLYARYRLYAAATIRTLLADGLPNDASIEEQWLVKYSRPTKIRFVGVWDTVGSLGHPLGSAASKVHKYRFLDTHLRLDNEHAFHALALDEHRHNFEPTFWTKTVKTGHRIAGRASGHAPFSIKSQVCFARAFSDRRLGTAARLTGVEIHSAGDRHPLNGCLSPIMHVLGDTDSNGDNWNALHCFGQSEAAL